MAQVDYSFIDGASGASACPPGQTIRTGIYLVSGSLTKNAVELSTTTINISNARVRIPEVGQSATVHLSVLENGSKEASRQTLGIVAAGTDLVANLKTFSNLKQNRRYTAVTHIGDVTKFLSRFCFKTAADLNINVAHNLGAAVNPGETGPPLRTSGCFAFSSDRSQIQACLCGARNASGEWARTDSEDGYEYIRDADLRQEMGCTTN